MQLGDLGLERWPASQIEQEVAPEEEYSPPLQSVHEPAWDREYFPGVQKSHEEAPAAADLPAAQG